MTSAEMIPAVILKKKAVVYVRQSSQSQVMTNLESKRRQYDLVDVAHQSASSTSKSLTTISAGRRADRWRARASTASWRGCAPARSALLCASMHPGLRETAAIGITSLNCAGLLKLAS